MCVSSFLPFGKMLSKKKHATDNFLSKFQNELFDTVIIMPVHTQNFLEILQNAHRVNFTHVNTITIYHTF